MHLLFPFFPKDYPLQHCDFLLKWKFSLPYYGDFFLYFLLHIFVDKKKVSLNIKNKTAEWFVLNVDSMWHFFKHSLRQTEKKPPKNKNVANLATVAKNSLLSWNSMNFLHVLIFIVILWCHYLILTKSNQLKLNIKMTV